MTIGDMVIQCHGCGGVNGICISAMICRRNKFLSKKVNHINLLLKLIAFASDAKSFATAFVVFFSSSFLLVFHKWTGKSSLRIFDHCDQDRTLFLEHNGKYFVGDLIIVTRDAREPLCALCFTYSSINNFLSPIIVSDWLIFCCAIWYFVKNEMKILKTQILWWKTTTKFQKSK